MLDVREEKLSDTFTKYHINLGDDVYLVLHHFTGVDGPVPHDHPWDFTSWILKGGYVEEVFHEGNTYGVFHDPGDVIDFKAEHTHRIHKLMEGECWTATMYGPKKQDFRFYPELVK